MKADEILRSKTSVWGGLSWTEASKEHPTEEPEVRDLRADAESDDSTADRS